MEIIFLNWIKEANCTVSHAIEKPSIVPGCRSKTHCEWKFMPTVRVITVGFPLSSFPLDLNQVLCLHTQTEVPYTSLGH